MVNAYKEWKAKKKNFHLERNKEIQISTILTGQ